MAIKAVGFVQYVSIDPSTLEFTIYYKVASNGEIYENSAGPFAKGTSALSVNATLLEAMQDDAENVLGETFTPVVDSVRIIDNLSQIA